MPKGGLRPNAGRKKANHTLAAEAARAHTIATVVKHLDPLLAAKLDLALGHLKEQPSLEGPRIYTTSPDGPAIRYLLDQTIGKPTETHEISGKDGGAVQVTVNHIVER